MMLSGVKLVGAQAAALGELSELRMHQGVYLSDGIDPHGCT